MQDLLSVMALQASSTIPRHLRNRPLEDVPSNKFSDAEDLKLRCGEACEYQQRDYRRRLAQEHGIVWCERPSVKPVGEDIGRSQFAETVLHWIDTTARLWSLATCIELLRLEHYCVCE